MSARSDLVNSAASVLSNPGGAVESGAPPSESGLMGAAMPAGSDTESTDDTRVTEEEGTEEAVKAEGEVAPATSEPAKEEPAKTEPAPAKPKFDAKEYTRQQANLARQHAALTRRQQAATEAEKKVMELISAKESEFSTREQKIAALEQLAELDEFEIVDRVAKTKGKTANDILRAALWKQAGYKPEPGEKTEGEGEAKPTLDAETLKMIKEAMEKADAAQKKLDAFEAAQAERERAQAKDEETRQERELVQHALSLVTEETHEYLSLEDPKDIARAFLHVGREQVKLYNDGKITELPSPEDILEHLDELARLDYQSKNERLQTRQKGSTPAPSAPAAVPPPAPQASPGSETQPKNSSGPKAITNALAAQTSPAVKGRIRKERALVEDAGEWLKSKGF